MSVVITITTSIIIHDTYGFHINPNNTKWGFLGYHDDPWDDYGHMTEVLTEDLLAFCELNDSLFVVEGKVQPEGYLKIHATTKEASNFFEHSWDIEPLVGEEPTAA